MSAPPGTAWAPGDLISAARMTLMSFLKLTSAQASALNPKFPGQAIFVKDTGVGFNQDTVYVLNTAGNAWIPMAGGKHKHDADTDINGGFYSDILVANATKVMNMQASVLGDYMNVGTGTATEEPTSGRIALTCAASGNFRHLSRGGVGLDFGRQSTFVFKGNSTANIQFTARIGACMENVNDAATDTRKYGIEACDSAGTTQNWQIISATGAGGSRTNTSTTSTALQAAATAYRLLHNVGSSVQFFVNNTLNQTKSTNIPASGSNSINNLSAGYRTNNATSKTLYVHHSRLLGSVSDTAFT